MARSQAFNTGIMIGVKMIRFYTLILAVFSSFTETDSSANTGQVFIQTDNELKFMIDGVPLPISSADSIIFTDRGSFTKQDIRSPVTFSPVMLDFGSQPVGMPSLRKVTVTNKSFNDNVKLISIIGSTPHFHCSFFRDKNLGPGANTTFDVIFLATQVGNIEYTLKIHTNQGIYMYHVFGVGTNNPFRLKPFIGAKIPVNSSYSPIIHMHNPFSKSLQVVEMFTSGGNLHLELPAGVLAPNNSLWELKPFETKPVMRATYLARKVSNETCYIRIKTKSLNGDDNLLILPMEVEVSNDPGLFSPQHILDFGVTHTNGDAKSLPLFIINSSTKYIEITDVFLKSQNDAIWIDFYPMSIPSGSNHMSPVAMVTVHPWLLSGESSHKGEIVIQSKEGVTLTVPYCLDFVYGSLRVDRSKLMIHTSNIETNKDLIRPLFVLNTFNRPLVIYNITSSNEQWLTRTQFVQPVILQPNVSMEISRLSISSAVKRMQGPLHAHIKIYTNVSSLMLPVSVFDGKVKTYFQHNDKELDFGSLGFKETRELFFTLRNDNPIMVNITDIYPTSKVTTVELVGVEEGNGTILTHPPDLSKITDNPLQLEPNHFAVYKVILTAPNEEGNYAFDIRVATTYDTFYVPVRFKSSLGSVKSIPERIIFEKAFPTNIPLKVLKIRSSFARYTEVTKVAFLPPDPRFGYERSKNTPTVLEPFQDTVIGHLYFDATLGSLNESYAGLPLNSPGGVNFGAGLSLKSGTEEVDMRLYSIFTKRWDKLKSKVVNVTVQVDTEWITNFLFPAEAQLVWPSLLEETNRIKFPPTQIGNMSLSSIVVSNPSKQPVIIQILPLELYPDPYVMIDLLLPGRNKHRISSLISSGETDVFTLQNLEKYNRKSNNPVPGYRLSLKRKLGVMPHPDSIATTLMPGVKVSVLIGFQPKAIKAYASLILIRNNLTVIDAVVVTGKGATSDLYIKEALQSEIEPHIKTVRYLVKESLLKSCSVLQQKVSSDEKQEVKKPFYALKNKFTLYNNGSLPVYVSGFLVGGKLCSHDSFIVENCSGFQLAANSSKEVVISYYADFSIALPETVVTVLASNNLTQNITVVFSIPIQLLSKCRGSLPRPEWESQLLIVVLIFLLLLFCAAILLAYLDMKKIFSDSIVKRFQKEGQLFDLRQISQQQNSKPQSNGKLPTSNKTASNSPPHELKKRIKSEQVVNGSGPRSNEKRQPQKSQAGESSKDGKKGVVLRSKTNVNTINNKLKSSNDMSNRQSAEVKQSPDKSAAVSLNNSGDKLLAPDKVNNQLVTGSSPVKLNKVNNTSKASSQLSDNVDSISKNEKHNHRNNLLKVDNSTITGTSTTPEHVETTALQQESGKVLQMLSDEARAKLKEDSRAQLKKQKKASQKNKTKKSQPAKEMVTKGVSTADLEDSQSVSTDSGSGVTSDGKNKHVTDWLHKLPDKSGLNPGWTNGRPASTSDNCSIASETPSWDTVPPEANDDLSELADITETFAQKLEGPLPHPSLTAVGTKPAKKSQVWGFPPPVSPVTSSGIGLSLPSSCSSPNAEDSNSIGLAPISQPENNENQTMMKRLLQEKRKKQEEYATKKQSMESKGLDDWPGFNTPLWNPTPSYWEISSPQVPPTSSIWSASESTWQPPSSTIWSDSGVTMLGTSPDSLAAHIAPTVTSTQSQVRHYDPFTSNVWSPQPDLTNSSSPNTSDNPWSFESN